LATFWPAYQDLVIASIQKNFDIRAAQRGCLTESALAPELEPVDYRFDMLAGAQTVDAVVGAVAAVNVFLKCANFHMVDQSAAGVDQIDTEKSVIRSLRFNPDWFSGSTQTTALDFIGITGGPAGRSGPPLRGIPVFLCYRHGLNVLCRLFSNG
jgi:hypothetical protein